MFFHGTYGKYIARRAVSRLVFKIQLLA